MALSLAKGMIDLKVLIPNANELKSYLRGGRRSHFKNGNEGRGLEVWFI
jgi:hypothetical protein